MPEIQRKELEKASGLAPSQFSRAENMLRSVVLPSDEPRLRRRQSSSTQAKVAIQQASNQARDKKSLVESAKQIQKYALANVPLSTGEQDVVSPPPLKRPAPEASVLIASRPSKRPSLGEKSQNQRDVHTYQAAQSVQSFHAQMPMPKPSVPNVPKQLRTPSTPPSSTADPSHLRLLSLGIPAVREGIKFDVQLRRKRGRPPAKRLTAQQMNDKRLLESLWSNAPFPSHLRMAGMPLRYACRANLDLHAMHWIRPLPRPVLAYSGNPSESRFPPSIIWERCISRAFPE